MKGTVEEKILLAGKKKMVLEHLIVHNLQDASGNEDEDEIEDVDSILKFACVSVFENGEESELKYSDAELRKLVSRDELLAQQQPSGTSRRSDSKAFSYAKVWQTAASNAEAADGLDEKDLENQRGFWDRLLAEQKLELARSSAEKAANLGKGKRDRKQRVSELYPAAFLGLPKTLG